MNFDAFISYASQNKAAADAACARLEAEGIRCWIAPCDVPPGSDWAGAIVDAIDHCRDELLNETLFTSLAQARAALAAWKDDYNTVRPHSALGNLSPVEYADRSAPGPQRGGTLRYTSAPRPVAPPSLIGSNETETLLIGG